MSAHCQHPLGYSALCIACFVMKDVVVHISKQVAARDGSEMRACD